MLLSHKFPSDVPMFYLLEHKKNKKTKNVVLKAFPIDLPLRNSVKPPKDFYLYVILDFKIKSAASGILFIKSYCIIINIFYSLKFILRKTNIKYTATSVFFIYNLICNVIYVYFILYSLTPQFYLLKYIFIYQTEKSF